MLMEALLWLQGAVLAIQFAITWRMMRARTAPPSPPPPLSRYEAYRREGLRALAEAGGSAADGLTTTAHQQEALAREWLARADQQPDAPPEVRALRELAEIE